MAKAKTIKMVTGNVTIDYIQFKRDKSNITDVLKFGNSKVFEEIINSNQRLHFLFLAKLLLFRTKIVCRFPSVRSIYGVDLVS